MVIETTLVTMKFIVIWLLYTCSHLVIVWEGVSLCEYWLFKITTLSIGVNCKQDMDTDNLLASSNLKFKTAAQYPGMNFFFNILFSCST